MLATLLQGLHFPGLCASKQVELVLLHTVCHNFSVDRALFEWAARKPQGQDVAREQTKVISLVVGLGAGFLAGSAHYKHASNKLVCEWNCGLVLQASAVTARSSPTRVSSLTHSGIQAQKTIAFQGHVEIQSEKASQPASISVPSCTHACVQRTGRLRASLLFVVRFSRSGLLAAGAGRVLPSL